MQLPTCFRNHSGATVSIQETVSIMEGTTGQICIVLEDVAGGLERAVSVTLTFTEGNGVNFVSSY